MGPVAASSEKYAFLSALSYIATEVHKGIGGLFGAKPELKEALLAWGNKTLQYANDTFLAGKTFAFGNSFTVVDAYLYIVLSWCGYVGLDLAAYPVAKAYYERISNLSNVKAAHAKIATVPSTIL